MDHHEQFVCLGRLQVAFGTSVLFELAKKVVRSFLFGFSNVLLESELKVGVKNSEQ
jgi:hypothetical protein